MYALEQLARGELSVDERFSVKGKRYYLATISALQRHAARCAGTHFVVLNKADGQGTASADCAASPARIAPPNDAALILVLITADEAAHIAIENDPEFEPLPHPLSRVSVSERVAIALAPFGVVAGDDTFTVAEKLARVNPLLRHRVF